MQSSEIESRATNSNRFSDARTFNPYRTLDQYCLRYWPKPRAGMSDDLRQTLEAGGIDPSSLGPFAAIVEALDAIVQSRIDQRAGDMKVAASNSAAEAMLAALDKRLHPDHVYGFKEVAQLTGKAVATLHKEPEVVLPRVLSKGRAIGVRGVDVLSYRGDITFDEARAYKEAQRQAVLRHI